MIRSDIAEYLNDYRGILGWKTFREVYSEVERPDIEIPLYIKESSVPIRAPKMTELSTVNTKDPGSQVSTTTNLIFFGAPDILQVQLSGWTVTPIVDKKWQPRDSSGNPLTFGNINYCDIIRYFIAGRFNRGLLGSWRRLDPDYYISPRGQRYTNPIISVFQPQASPTMKKQAFEMTLMLEA